MRPLLALALALVAAPALAQSADTQMPRLKASATVTRDIVRIGDLIENAREMSDIAIFRAPDPGSTGSVSAERVLEAARAHDLLLVDTGGLREVEVTRVSRAITRPEIEERVVRTFASRFGSGDPGRFDLTFDREPLTLHVEPQATGDLQVVRSSYEPYSKRFDVTFLLPGSSPAQQQVVRYSGRLVETAPAVVLARPLSRGETVRAADLMVERRAKSELTGDTLSLPAEALGLAARQPLRAGVPLRRNDLVKAEIVRRDEAVTLIYEAPGITLTVRGKALDGGAEGDLINVLNAQSKRTIQGVVSGPGRVIIGSSMPVAVAQASEPAAQAGHSE